MQTTSLQTLHLSPPFSRNFTSTRVPWDQRKRFLTALRAMKSDADSGKGHDHRLVDENMIVLKMRIQELRMKDQEKRVDPSNGWMEWEKELCKNYDSNVYDAIGFLQILLMNTRPSLVVGVVALLVFSTSTSLVVLLSYLLGVVM